MDTEQHTASGNTDPTASDSVEKVVSYHVRTKHHFNRYARSLGFLDWVNQPDPFRRFEGSPLISLPLLKPDDEPVSPLYEAIYQRDAMSSQPVTRRTLSRFFEFALALSAWKRAGESEWALRSNPSSGNLHPTEGYLVVPRLDGLELEPGVYHYAPKEHGLELRAKRSAEEVARLLAPFPDKSFLFGLTSIHWREAWKYGERAFRYCNHDVGHAIGTARIAAATLGWNMMVLDEADQNTVAMVLGTHRAEDFHDVEPEHPDCLCVIWQVGAVGGERSEASDLNREIPQFLGRKIAMEFSEGPWYGRANRLSREHGIHWDIIDEVAEATWKVHASTRTIPVPVRGLSPATRSSSGTTNQATAGQIIRQRRSAVAFDAKTSIAAELFFRMLQRVMPQAEREQLRRPMPWDVWPYDPAVHLMLFVHRIDGLTPGLYFLVRDPASFSRIRAAMNPELTWTAVPGCPEDVPLYWLLEGDARRLAAQVSCHQEIAGDSAFSLGMIVEFEGLLRERGAWWYPRLFWETGLLGQVLYLEAEASGVRATGIGCFFDDPVHEIVAIKGLSFQSLYHFTIGGPVEDRRLMTLPPYFHKQAGG